MKRLLALFGLLLFTSGRNSPLWSLLTALPLPGSEDTTADMDFYVHEDSCDHLRFNTADILPAAAAVAAGDLVIIGPAGGADHELNWVGIVDDAALINADTSAFVKEGILVRTAKLSLVPGDAAFTAFGQEVWYDPVAARVQSQEDDDVYLVGYVREPTDALGVMGFEKRRYAILGTST